MYLAVNKLKHHDLSVMGSGLVINPECPFIGASPDVVINCTCCGKGVIEIKINVLIAIEAQMFRLR